MIATLFPAHRELSSIVHDCRLSFGTIEADFSGPKHSAALLRRHGVRVFATVYRIDPRQLCLRFDEPFSDGQRARFVNGAAPVPLDVIHDCKAA